MLFAFIYRMKTNNWRGAAEKENESCFKARYGVTIQYLLYKEVSFLRNCAVASEAAL